MGEGFPVIKFLPLYLETLRLNLLFSKWCALSISMKVYKFFISNNLRTVILLFLNLCFFCLGVWFWCNWITIQNAGIWIRGQWELGTVASWRCRTLQSSYMGNSNEHHTWNSKRVRLLLFFLPFKLALQIMLSHPSKQMKLTGWPICMKDLNPKLYTAISSPATFCLISNGTQRYQILA